MTAKQGMESLLPFHFHRNKPIRLKIGPNGIENVSECLCCGHLMPLAVWREVKVFNPDYKTNGVMFDVERIGVCGPCRDAAEPLRGPCSPKRGCVCTPKMRLGKWSERSTLPCPALDAFTTGDSKEPGEPLRAREGVTAAKKSRPEGRLSDATWKRDVSPFPHRRNLLTVTKLRRIERACVTVGIVAWLEPQRFDVVPDATAECPSEPFSFPRVGETFGDAVVLPVGDEHGVARAPNVSLEMSIALVAEEVVVNRLHEDAIVNDLSGIAAIAAPGFLERPDHRLLKRNKRVKRATSEVGAVQESFAPIMPGHISWVGRLLRHLKPPCSRNGDKSHYTRSTGEKS